MRPGRVFLAGAALISVAHGSEPASAPDPASPPGWSQELLDRLLSAPIAGAESSSSSSGDGLILQSYQLRNLRIGSPGRASHLVSILRRMLPIGCRVTEDPAMNALHVLSPRTTHEAALELISSMDDEPEVAPSLPGAAHIPEEVRSALLSLAATRPDAETLAKAVNDAADQTEQRVSVELRRSQEEAQRSLRRTLVMVGGAAAALAAVGLLASAVVFRRGQAKQVAALLSRERAGLVLGSPQSLELVMAASREQQERTRELQKLMESFSISYQAERQRSALLLETVAQKHQELTTTLESLEHLHPHPDVSQALLELNRTAIDELVERAANALGNRAAEVGVLAESASRKMEETASRLEVQNARTEALAAELERTQLEVDALFEKLTAAQTQAQRAQDEAHEQRRIATEKAAQLARKEAALAGLSLLMQEPMGSILDTLDGVAGASAVDEDPSSEAAVPLEGEAEQFRFATPTDTDGPSSAQGSDSCVTQANFRILPVA